MKLFFLVKYNYFYPILLLFLFQVAVPLKVSAEPDLMVEWKKIADPKTGHEVWQMTSHDSGSVGFYFERQAFTTDDKYVVFTSNRSGSQQLYKANLSSGEITQLTDLEGVQTGNMHPDGIHCLFQAGVSLMQVHVSSGEIETLVDGKNVFPSFPRWAGSYSADGKLTTVSCKTENGTEMFLVDMRSEKMHPVLNWNGVYSHPLMNPKYPHLITFVPGPDTQNNMDLPMEKRARTWILDTQTGQTRQFLTCPYGFRATHESWSTDGERFYFYKKTVPGWVPVSICSINKEGKDWQEHYTHQTIKLGHGISSPDGKWFISDGQEKNNNPLILLNIKTGKETLLCWPDASIAGEQFTHVHPSFSSSGKYVYFTSDRTGKPQVYVMKIPLD